MDFSENLRTMTCANHPTPLPRPPPLPKRCYTDGPLPQLAPTPLKDLPTDYKYNRNNSNSLNSIMIFVTVNYFSKEMCYYLRCDIHLLQHREASQLYGISCIRYKRHSELSRGGYCSPPPYCSRFAWRETFVLELELPLQAENLLLQARKTNIC